jgi:hypothetical protein
MNNELQEIQEYLNQLTKKQKIALNKAKEILGDSFNIKKSVGFIIWNNKK